MTKLQDTDQMPWGKYQGIPLQDVPASYLHWLWVNAKDPLKNRIKVCPVADYIQRSLKTLMHEHEDGIW